MTYTKVEVPPGGITPSKLVGKDVHSVVDRMKTLNLTHRVVRQNGLLTADYNPQRYTLWIDENELIVAAELG